MSSHTGAGNINAAITAANANYTIEIAPGTYTDTVGTMSVAGLKFVATATVAETLCTGAWTIDTDAISIDGLTLSGGVTSTAAGTNLTIQNSVFSTAGTLLTIGGTPATISNNTLTTAAGGTGIVVNAEASLSGNDITLGDAAATGIVLNANGTVSGCTITGASGTGINVTAGTVGITGSSLSALARALEIDGGTVSITGSTITGCGDATTAGAGPTINVDGATSVRIADNTIADCADEILQIALTTADAEVVFMNFNTITNPALGIDNNDTTNTVDCTNNWWGAATGPAAASDGLVKTSPFLRGLASSGTIYPGLATTGTNATVGVIVLDSSATAATWINAGVALYDANPAAAEPPAEVTKYLDVYVNPATTAPVTTSVTITILGIQSAAAQVYAWSATQGLWVLCSNQTVDLFQGGVVVTITAATTPTLTNLAGLEFALTEPALTPMGAVTGASLVPAIAATGVSINPTFTWLAVAGADHYDFVIAEEIGQDDPFAIPEYADTCAINAHVAKKTLKYDTQYNWRVRPGRITGIEEIAPGDVREIVEKGAWVVGLFVTGSEPVEAEPPIVIEDQPAPPAPQITLNPTPVTVNVPDANVEVIPDTLLYVIIGVGAVLVIAVIVLIVRTRRV